MAYQTFPTGVAFRYSLVRTPQFDTLVIGYGGPVEQRIAKQSAANWNIKARFDSLQESDAEQIIQFFIDRKGAYEAFYLRNPEEATRNVLRAANTHYNIGAIVRPDTVNNHSYKCTATGTTHATNPVTWPTGEKSTVVDGTVTWTENSYLARFKEDAINIEYFTYMLYTLGEIDFKEVNS